MKNKLTNEDIDAIQEQCAEQVWEPFPGICREHLRNKLWKLYGFALKEQFGRGDEE